MRCWICQRLICFEACPLDRPRRVTVEPPRLAKKEHASLALPPPSGSAGYIRYNSTLAAKYAMGGYYHTAMYNVRCCAPGIVELDVSPAARALSQFVTSPAPPSQPTMPLSTLRIS